jgi:hypothetical protein
MPEELQARLLRHLSFVVRQRDPVHAFEGHAAVRDYVTQEMAAYGSVTTHEFAHGGRIHQNLVLDLAGRHNDGFVLVGAHYDAVPGTPGADDNASALAVLLELARAFSKAPALRPIRLVAFDLEEVDRAGSQAYAQDLRVRGEPLHLMVALEMLGYRDPRPGSQRYPLGLRHLYPDRGDFIGLIGSLRTLPQLWRLARTMRGFAPCEFLPVPNRGLWIPDTRRSDHASFWDLGYPAIMVTDTANMRNPHYHKASDCLETLDIDFLSAVCAGLIAGLSSL